jgi:transposase
MSLMPSTEEMTALQEALNAANRRSESLAGELLLVRTERDLLKERLGKFMRKIFAAKSEISSQSQKDMFFNEAEVLGAQAQPATQEDLGSDDEGKDVPAHKRAKRGRKPLDPALPRHVVRHELPESERVCPHDGSPLKEIGVEASEQLDIIPQQVRVIRHERVKYACPCCRRLSS